MTRCLRARVGHRARAGIAALLVVLVFVLLGSAAEAPLKETGTAAASIDFVDVPVYLPPGYASPALCRSAPPRWVLPGHSAADLESLLAAAGLDGDQRRALASMAECGGNGCSLSPSRAIVLGLRPDVRAELYRALGRFPENTEQWVPFRRRRELGPWSAHPGLPESARLLLDRLTYIEGPFFLLADFAVLCAELPSDGEKVPALEALMSRGSLDAKLQLSPSDRDHAVPLAELLPPFARARLNTFQPVGDAGYSCFWTALHFFDERDPSLAIEAETEAAMLDAFQRDYLPVPFEQRRLGDVIFLETPGGRPVHAVNQVAGEVVFTKNGASFLRPWVLMRLSDVRASYPAGTELRALRLRRHAELP